MRGLFRGVPGALSPPELLLPLECCAGIVGTGGGRVGGLLDNGRAAKELKLASADCERENQLFLLDVRFVEPSMLKPLRILSVSDLSPVRLVDALRSALPLLCLLACLAAIFGSTGMGGSS